MRPERRIFWGAVVVATLAVAALLAWPEVAGELAPEPVGAWVAVQAPGSGVARTGRLASLAGSAVTLHAVLEARTRGGEAIYYTEAPALEIGGQAVPATALRRWNGPLEARVLWFSVEGSTPYLPIEGEEALASLRWEEFFHPDWPRAWSVPATVESRFDDHLSRGAEHRERDFGTQRYSVRIELVDPRRPSLVAERYASPGAAAMPGDVARVATLVARLPPPLEAASAVFGLIQIEPPPEADPPLLARLAELAERELAFSRLQLLRDVSGGSLASLPWREVSLAEGGPAWDDEVGPGDLVRVGARVLVLWRDAGAEGVLDAGDLAFDYQKGAVILPLGEVFGGDLVEWASRGAGRERRSATVPAPGEGREE